MSIDFGEVLPDTQSGTRRRGALLDCRPIGEFRKSEVGLCRLFFDLLRECPIFYLSGM